MGPPVRPLLQSPRLGLQSVLLLLLGMADREAVATSEASRRNDLLYSPLEPKWLRGAHDS